MKIPNPHILAFAKLALVGSFLLSVVGCNTLASLGLPVSAPSNSLLSSARSISNDVHVSAPIPKELNESVLANYLVEVGDSLYVEPAKFDSPVRLPGDQRVKPDGTIDLGMYGYINVVGKTIPQIQTEIQSMIESKESKCGPINVRLIDWESKVFYVLGEVNSPGAFRFNGNETILDAILKAGGMNRKADHHHIVLSRPTPECSCRVVLPICYDQIVQLGDTSTNYQIMPGDRIFVSGISFADDIRQSLLPFCQPNCPRCSGKPVGCDPCSLTTPTVSHFPQHGNYENTMPPLADSEAIIRVTPEPDDPPIEIRVAPNVRSAIPAN